MAASGLPISKRSNASLSHNCRLKAWVGSSPEKGELFTVYGDREGNLWLGTLHNGLYRLRKQVVTNYSHTQGLTKGEIYPIYEDRAGTIWLGTTGGLNRYQNGMFTQYPQSPPAADNSISSLFEDRAGRIWANGRPLLVDGRLARGPVAEVLPPAMGNCWTMYEDQEGAFWFGADHGVVRYKVGVRAHFTTKDGLAGDDTKVILGDVAGGLWLGSYGGLTHFKDGRFTVWRERDGLPGSTVRALKQDSDGSCGLARMTAAWDASRMANLRAIRQRKDSLTTVCFKSWKTTSAGSG
jgi:ligand-binding sensor domain-containing protein